jgi:segregation and condensation protein A
VTPLGELTVRWTGSDDGEVEITDEFDGTPPEDAGTSAEDAGTSAEIRHPDDPEPAGEPTYNKADRDERDDA